MERPRIRFKRDDGTDYPSWRTVPFGELSVPSGIRNKNNADLDSYSISNDKGFVPQSEQFEDAGYLNNADRSLYYIVSPGSFAYNPARINIGSIGYQNVGKDVLVSSLYEIFNTTKDLDDRFLMNWFRSEQFQKYVRRLSEGGVRQYFYYDKLCMVQFPLPCLEEQQKIADFLSSVDEVIATSEQEVANLETQKKAALKKIFSQEVRFKRADGEDFPEWETKTLGEIAEIRGGGTPSTSTEEYWKDGDIEWFTPTEVGREKYVISSKRKITTYGLTKSSARVLPVGTLLLTTRATIGEMSIARKECCTNQGFQSLVVHPNINNEYVYYCQPIIKEYCIKHAAGSTFLEISGSGVAKCPISIPCLEEQHLIADFLSNFDEAIAAAKKELELWKQLKKGLLQQLFV